MNKTKHFKRLWGLMLLLIAMLMPQGAWAIDFISEIKYAVHDKQATAYDYLSGYTIIKKELNNNENKSGEYWVYIGYKTSTDPSKAITDIMVVSGSSYLSGHLESDNSGNNYVTFTGDTRKWYRCPSQGKDGTTDINRGNGGDDLCIYYTRDGNTTNGKSAITTLDVVYETGVSGWTYAKLFKNSSITANGNTNEGTGGTPTYIVYKSHTHSYTTQTTPATCVATGLRKTTCSCGVIEEVLPIDPNAHKFENGLCIQGYFRENGEMHYQAPVGEGTESSPYKVANVGNLEWIHYQLCSNPNSKYNILQIADIDFTKKPEGWGSGYIAHIAIGKMSDDNIIDFCGTYNGNGYVIKGMSQGCWSYSGLFAKLNNATIRNVGIVGADISVRFYGGAISGLAINRSQISQCYVVNSKFNFIENDNGVICGKVDHSSLDNCYTDCKNYTLCGSLVNDPEISDCYGTSAAYSSGSNLYIYRFKKIEETDIASGSLCYTMNGEQTNGTQTWYQNLGSGAEGFPRPQKNTAYTVYKVKGYKCDGVTQKDFYSNNSSATPVDAHSFASTFTTDEKATCTKPGSKSKHCTVCSAKAEETSIDMLSHQMTEHAAKSPTSCADAGNYKYYTCSQSCCSDKYYKDNGSHTTNTYENKDATLWRKPHTFAASDLTQDECTVCHHGFFRYTSVNNVVYEPRRPSNLKGADGNSLEILYNTNVEGKGVMEFNKPLVIIDSYALCYVIIGMEFSGELIIPNTVITIGDEAFSLHENITKLTIGNSVRTIGEQAFRYCKNLTGNLTIPNSVESIGKSAFYGCQKLNGKLTISNSVKTIDKDAFGYCTGLTSVEMQSVPQIGEYAFDYVTGNKTLVLSDDSYVYNGGNSNFPGMNKVTYTRKGIKNQWGTIVVPFDVTGSDDYDFYTLTSATNEELTLTKVNGTLNAGTPALIRINTELVTDQTYDLELNSAEGTVTVNADVENGSSANGLTLTGSYGVKEITDENGYIISNNKFWSIQEVKGENSVYCAPFRAYIASSAPASAKALNISISEEADAIEAITAITEGDAEYYDMNGRKLNSLQIGVNIVKYSNGKTKKVVIK